ncbi:hypothetical protein [Microcoleus sp. bin38.metabat.b11b12b14.051]|uniref:hypothetical protein n=1 Tax=Microcoleus sp. bin38.metabat.b11b12b14.051 TaxID=2742709 RepID=UPI0025D95F66|nr:hypothetical protein [Microcoleus sp. bin38.metabat.b11b12b14.051]
MKLANTPIKQKWVIAIVLLISRKPACHTLKTYAYPVIQQGRKRVGIASNLPASLFFVDASGMGLSDPQSKAKV